MDVSEFKASRSTEWVPRLLGLQREAPCGKIKQQQQKKPKNKQTIPPKTKKTQQNKTTTKTIKHIEEALRRHFPYIFTRTWLEWFCISNCKYFNLLFDLYYIMYHYICMHSHVCVCVCVCVHHSTPVQARNWPSPFKPWALWITGYQVFRKFLCPGPSPNPSISHIAFSLV